MGKLAACSTKCLSRIGGQIANDIGRSTYLTDAGAGVFDTLYRLHLTNLARVASGGGKVELWLISMKDLMKDARKLVVGVRSKCFTFCQVSLRALCLQSRWGEQLDSLPPLFLEL